MNYAQQFASPKFETINLAFSCGIDSVFAAYFIKFKLKRPLHLFHFNHGLRNENNLMEEAALQFADFFDIPISIGVRQEEVANGSLEAFCRQIRYDWMQTSVPHITVVHHLDDAVENYVSNMLKGKPEHTPIKPISAFGKLKIFRPFILTTRKEIEVFVENHKLGGFVYHDETNEDQKYMRNWIRHAVIPTISGRYAGLHKVVKKKFYL